MFESERLAGWIPESASCSTRFGSCGCVLRDTSCRGHRIGVVTDVQAMLETFFDPNYADHPTAAAASISASDADAMSPRLVPSTPSSPPHGEPNLIDLAEYARPTSLTLQARPPLSDFAAGERTIAHLGLEVAASKTSTDVANTIVGEGPSGSTPSVHLRSDFAPVDGGPEVLAPPMPGASDKRGFFNRLTGSSRRALSESL